LESRPLRVDPPPFVFDMSRTPECQPAAVMAVISSVA
jgi:hypothetical protein